MCFSTEVSFGAAIVLTGIGGLTLRQVTDRRQIWLAIIPFLFALQQAAEGVLWVGLTNHWVDCGLECVARYVFLISAFCTWPWLFPLALSQVEPNQQRRSTLYGFLMAGLALSIYNFLYLFNQGMGAQIVQHSIQYTNTLPKEGPHLLSPRKCALAGLFPQIWLSLWDYWGALLCHYRIFLLGDLHLGLVLLRCHHQHHHLLHDEKHQRGEALDCIFSRINSTRSSA